MVVAAAAADGIALEEAKAGGGLAGVGDTGVGAIDFAHVGGGEGGDAAEALREVEGDALGLEDAARGSVNGSDHGIRGEGLSVIDVEGGGDERVGEGEGGGDEVLTAEDAGLARDQLGGDAGGRGDEGLGGEIAPGGVFEESEANDGVDGFSAGFHQHGTATWEASMERAPAFWV